MPGFVITTIGCKVNQYESQSLAELLTAFGLTALPSDRAAGLSGDRQQADLVAVNTCCVTAAAGAKTRRAIRLAIRRHAGADLLIVGCWATLEPQGLLQLARQAGCTGSVHVTGHDGDIATVARSAAQAVLRRCRKDPRQSVELCPHAGRWNSTKVSPGPLEDDGCMRTEPTQLPAKPASSAASISGAIETCGQSAVKHNVMGIAAFAEHQRAFVKVQDGCDAGCSYCIVPRVRGRIFSRPAEEILAESAALLAAGHKEIVLCGIHLGAYGRTSAIRADKPEPTATEPLAELVRQLVALPNLWRLRLSSLEVLDMTAPLLAALAGSPRVAPHLHLPLQSGSDRILGLMNRRYTPAEYLETIRRLRAAFDRPAITTDIIVGFPGESDADFAATLEVARRAGFSKIHIFPFSPRRGTPAWSWRADCPSSTITTTRCRQLASLDAQLSLAYREQFLGQTIEAVVELPTRRTPPGQAAAMADRHVTVGFATRENLTGQLVRLRITGTTSAGLSGELND